MFKAAFSLISLAVFFSVTVAQDASITHVGYTGTLSSLDGGFGGVVRVLNTTALEITNYMLEDGSAPALYWWGSTGSSLRNGFRISNKQVNKAATSDTIVVILDAGKTSADFITVGLWCEAFSVNFGQTTLKAPTSGIATGAATGGSASQTTSIAGAAATSKNSAGSHVARSQGGIVFGFVVAVMFAICMI